LGEFAIRAKSRVMGETAIFGEIVVCKTLLRGGCKVQLLFLPMTYICSSCFFCVFFFKKMLLFRN
jgi:hypothetical protein